MLAALPARAVATFPPPFCSVIPVHIPHIPGDSVNRCLAPGIIHFSHLGTTLYNASYFECIIFGWSTVDSDHRKPLLKILLGSLLVHADHREDSC